MRIAFVEVRDKTALFSAVARRLPDWEVAWLVQNRAFADHSMKNLTVLPYPKRHEYQAMEQPREPVALGHLSLVRRTDRFTHFGHGAEHYNWYYDKLSKWLDATAPEIIIGEVGNFHSHMLMLLAKQRGIPFINPVSSRYPPGRFAFFLGDRLVPVGGCADPSSDDEVDMLVDDIVSGKRAPDYMTTTATRRRKFAYRVKILSEWLRGERFATQSPPEFLISLIRRRRVVRHWERNSAEAQVLPSEMIRPRILYPLQMQPELNLDVWGRHFRDQGALVETLARATQEHGGSLLVKPNPKSFHEMSKSLARTLAGYGHVTKLGHKVSMREVIESIDLVVTVSGTVAIERLMRQEPVLILLDDYARWLGVPTAREMDISPAELSAAAIEQIARYQQSIQPRDVLRRLISTSYQGLIAEPLNALQVLDRENVRMVEKAVRHVAPIASASMSGDR